MMNKTANAYHRNQVFVKKAAICSFPRLVPQMRKVYYKVYAHTRQMSGFSCLIVRHIAIDEEAVTARISPEQLFAEDYMDYQI